MFDPRFAATVGEASNYRQSNRFDYETKFDIGERKSPPDDSISGWRIVGPGTLVGTVQVRRALVKDWLGHPQMVLLNFRSIQASHLGVPRTFTRRQPCS
ncbi:hypothetical protein XI06_06985 [Bradyrhizobium sp. CCBAU 11434]|nr:hypothetical protein [Bradyrhizobium sp. CCBAU 11434]